MQSWFDITGDDARDVFVLAASEARGRGQQAVGTEDIVVALHLVSGPVSEMLDQSGASLAVLRTAVAEEDVAAGGTSPEFIPFSPHARLSMTAAVVAHHRESPSTSIEPWHFLVGVLDVPWSRGARLLESIADVARLRRLLQELEA